MIGPRLALIARRCPRGLLGMVVLVAIVEGAIEWRSLALFDVDDWAYRWTARAATRAAKPCRVLCLGDSLIKLGVIPGVVGERLGRSTFNLALSGGQASTSYFVLKHALDAGARPEAVVVDFAPPLLRVGPSRNVTRWGALLGPLEAAELAWWAGEPALFGEVAAGRVLPSLRGKATIRAALMDALASRPSTARLWNGMALRNWKENAGAQLMTGSTAAKGLSDLDVDRLREGYYPHWSCHPANARAVDRFLALAADRDIRVFWVLTPLLPALHDRLASSGIDRQHEAFLRSWQDKYPNLVVVDARRKAVDLDAFWDPQHLSVGGAVAFSRALGDALRGPIAGDGPRWVALPEFRAGPPGPSPGVEDIDQSRLAIEAGVTRRR